MGRKVGAAVPLSMKEKLGLHLTQCGLAEAYLCTNWYLDPSSILATTDMGRKVRVGSAPFFGSGAGSPSNTKSPRPRPSSVSSDILIHAAIWPQHILAEHWGCAPLGRGAGSPSNTMWPGLGPNCMPSFTLILRTVWPPTSQRGHDRQTGQTDTQNNGLIAYDEPFYKRSPKTMLA